MAVHDNDGNRVRNLLQQGANPNHPLYQREGWWSKHHGDLDWKAPPLHTACERGNLVTVKLLIQAGANIDEVDSTNSTPLHAACEEGNQEVALYLIREAGCKTGEFVL